MSCQRVWKVVKKDLLVGPRKPIFLWAIAMPLVLTILFQAVFGSLFEPKPRLGIVDGGDSEITRAVQELTGIELTLVDSVPALKQRVEQHDLDAGLVLPAGFDQAVRAGERPQLQFFLGGESLASHRLILMVTALDLLRELEQRAAPVVVETVLLGEVGLPLNVRLIPILVFYALVLAGVFVPGSSLVEEKERRTLTAVLVTPVRASELLAAKWLLGLIFAVVLSAATLLLNNAFGPRPLDVLGVIVVAASLCAMLGVLVGVVSQTSGMLFALIKGAGLFLFAPVIFYLFPDWPQWIARIFPLYWIIEPVWQVSVMGQPLSRVGFELGVALGITLVLMLVISRLGRHLEV